MRADRPALVGLAAIVALSTALHTLGSRLLAPPWIAPDESIYLLIGRSFWHTGRLTLLGSDAPFYGLYPVFAGLAPALLGTASGIAVLQFVQALLASATAAVVYAWAAPSAGPRWALVAAALTAVLPAIVYSGLLMTESLFLPAATLALWSMARALVAPTRSRQAVVIATILLACACRIQGVVLIPVLVAAIVLAAWFGRDLRLARQFVPLLVTVAVLGLLWLSYNLVATGTLASSLGAYAATSSSGYDRIEAARWVFIHAGDLFLLVLGAPLVAMLVLAYDGARGRERDPRVRALVAVALSASTMLTVQVGIFSSRYVGQLAERDLIAAVPPLLVCFVIWLSRGMPRPQPATSVIALAVAVPAVLLPVRTVVTNHAVPDAFMTIPLWLLVERTSPGAVAIAWVAAAALIVTLTVLLPRSAAVLLPLILAVAYVVTSVTAVREVGERSRYDQSAFLGAGPPSWVNRAATGPVAYLYDGNPFWNAVWATVVWNDRINMVARLPGPAPGPIPSPTDVTPEPDGRLVTRDGSPIHDREVVASTAFTLIGEAIAEIRQDGAEQAGLRLWRTPGPPRLSTVTLGLRANGDITEPVRVVVYACRNGHLDLTLLGKEEATVLVSIDGKTQRHIPLRAGDVWTGSVPAPRDGRPQCEYELTSTGLAGSTRIEFVRE